MVHLCRCLLGAAAAAIALVAGVAGAQTAAPADGERMNVLFIAIDDLKPALGVYGDRHAVTPHMDELAASGSVFLNAHCQQAVCAPSRVSVLTGLRPDTTRVWDLKTELRDTMPDVVTLPGAFKQAGYQSVGMGKIFDARSAGGYGDMDRRSWTQDFINVWTDAGHTFWYRNPDTVARIEAAQAQPDYPQEGWRAQLNYIFPEGQPTTDRADVPDEAYHGGAMTEEAKKHLAGFAESGEPFFLAVGYRKPHLPFQAPERYWQLHDRDAFELATLDAPPEGAPAYAPQFGREIRRHYNVPDDGPFDEALQRELVHGYYASTSFIDAQVGELMEELDARGLSDDTLVVLWSDHGFHLGDHAMWCKHTTYEQATRSVLMVRDPRLPGGVTSDSPVELLDIYPTTLDLAGLPVPDHLQGMSLRPVVTGETDRVKDHAVSQYHRLDGDTVLMGYAFRDDRYRLVQWREQPGGAYGHPDGPVVATELYDYEADPPETRNLAGDPAYAEVRATLEAAAEAFAR